jgi:hypothetical protein
VCFGWCLIITVPFLIGFFALFGYWDTKWPKKIILDFLNFFEAKYDFLKI